MIDIKTLRIGSHVLAEGKRERVRGMDEDNGLIVRFPAEYVMANEVEPIPITPELLKELGFKQDNDERLPEYTYWRKNHKGYPLELTYWGEHSNSQNREMRR